MKDAVMKRLIFLMLMSVFIMAGCNDDDNEELQPDNEVRMGSVSFIPATLTVPAGTTVRWINSSSVEHTVTSSDELFDEQVSPGETFSYTFSDTGTYGYICTIHAGMSGTVVVE